MITGNKGEQESEKGIKQECVRTRIIGRKEQFIKLVLLIFFWF